MAGAGIGGLCCAYELMERGHEVTVLEASGRPGGHVKTVHDPLPDGLYADVGAEHFTRPGYDQYWKYVEKFGLPAVPYPAPDQHAQADRRNLVYSRRSFRSRSSSTRGRQNIEHAIVHNWAKDPWAFGCERMPFPLGQLKKFWPNIMEPVGRVHFAGSFADNLPWGMDAATPRRTG